MPCCSIGCNCCPPSPTSSKLPHRQRDCNKPYSQPQFSGKLPHNGWLGNKIRRVAVKSLHPRKDEPQRGWIIGILAIASLVLLASIGTIIHQLTESWWFSNIGHSEVFWTQLLGRIFAGGGTFLVFALVLWGNYRLATHLTRYTPFRWGYNYDSELINRSVPVIVLFTAIVGIAFWAAQLSLDAWELVLKFWHAQPFGTTDPIYQRDIGFYIFRFPLYTGLRSWLMGLVIASFAITIAVYSLKGSLDFGRGWNHAIIGKPKTHLTLLVMAVVGLIAWGYWLERYNLLYSPTGVVFGAGYTDVHARLLGLTAMFLLSLALAIALLFSLWQNSISFVSSGLLGFVLVAFVVQGLIPLLQQTLVVEPNELNKELPYIEHNLQFTRRAYDLDDIDTRPFPVEGSLDAAAIATNQATITNVRLWSYRPLLSTYRQLQEIRLYYRFNDVDVDRYTLDGDYRQVMLSPRELAYGQVPERGRTWVNQRLKYTHGYGAVLSPVNRVSEQGLPELWIKDIPPVSAIDLEITQPRLYYGEETTYHVFTGTSTNEFDFPQGGDNASNRYDGAGGVAMPTLLHRLAYALDLGSFKLLISNYFTPESKILYHREIRDRIQRVVPFLRLDRDPYLCINNGRLQWIMDAYTTSDRYPYSEPFGRGQFNYIRNSVKVVVDAYDGTLQFFITDTEDPILKAYQEIFPNLFTPAADVPEVLRSHFRYPLDLFAIQAQTYLAYHMQNAEVFYNQEDLWRFPNQLYEQDEQVMEPYYVIVRLPDAESEEFVLTLPFTPVNKNNMVAWLAARSDGDRYGKKLLYEFPKQQLVYGPQQIEARIDQNPQISQQLTLWSQEGSQVIRGDLFVIPIEQSLLYVEPIYLRAEQSELPELKRVILAYGDQIVMETTLEQAIATIFGAEANSTSAATATPSATAPAAPPPSSIPTPQLRQALELHEQAEAAQRAGDWAAYGRLQDELGELLQTLNGQTDAPDASEPALELPES
ncbi:MAG: UPF0182 family protein [Spirulinaceae cyanobacterium SM2_1_0]|nr:UPF0182 family protein [Spirulinaceae cyanobacterium SM2_1_0]